MCVGAMPCDPRSSRVSARPVPKSCSQTRFTNARDVRGFCEDVSHMANPIRFLGARSGKGFKEFGTSGSTLSPLTNQLPRSKTKVSRRMDAGFSIITGVEGTFDLNNFQNVFFISWY